MHSGKLLFPKSTCESGCKLILKHAEEYADAAEALFCEGRKKEAYALSYLGMDELGKFILIANAFKSSSSCNMVEVRDFYSHRTKIGQVVKYFEKLKKYDALRYMPEIARNLPISDIARLAYNAWENGTFEDEIKRIDTDPMTYRNRALYVDYMDDWKETRYPGDEICAAQIKLVKGTAKGYLYLIEQRGLENVVRDL